ncbi:MAG: Hsp20/alpha crystallin family protein [Ignavibacteriales bacterium]|nr:Hsp20/alpha crystallin family protein [Ignavibacteriales bacterium]
MVDNAITVEGEKKMDTEENTRYYINERITGTFKRSFKMPFEVDRDSVEAKFTDGILSITIARAERAPEPNKNIEIK